MWTSGSKLDRCANKADQPLSELSLPTPEADLLLPTANTPLKIAIAKVAEIAMISTLTLRFERLLNFGLRGVQLRVCAVGVELCVETCRVREPGLIGSTAYSKIPTPPYNYMVICRTSNALTVPPWAMQIARVSYSARPVHVTSRRCSNSRYDADPVGWIERYEILTCVESTFRNVCIVRLRGRSRTRLRERLGIRKHACNRNGQMGNGVMSTV